MSGFAIVLGKSATAGGKNSGSNRLFFCSGRSEIAGGVEAASTAAAPAGPEVAHAVAAALGGDRSDSERPTFFIGRTTAAAAAEAAGGAAPAAAASEEEEEEVPDAVGASSSRNHSCAQSWLGRVGAAGASSSRSHSSSESGSRAMMQTNATETGD